MKRLHHPHKSIVNWALYDLMDAHMYRLAPVIRGDLYDLGCGERPYEHFFLQYCDSYTGVDWGATFHKLKADVVSDLNQPLPIASNCADTVVSLSVLEHLSKPAVMLGEAYRILRNDGILIMEVPFMWHEHESPYDYYRFTCNGLRYLLKEAGFADVDVQPISGVWSTIALKFNYQLARLIRGGPWGRRCATLLLSPILWATQAMGLMLDRIGPKSDDETAGYFVTARKNGT